MLVLTFEGKLLSKEKGTLKGQINIVALFYLLHVNKRFKEILLLAAQSFSIIFLLNQLRKSATIWNEGCSV
jgi:hypothetical protein